MTKASEIKLKNKINSSEDITPEEVSDIMNTVKQDKLNSGLIKNSAEIVEKSDFAGKTLKIEKCLFKNGKNYSYPAGKKWEDIDAFGKKNIQFSINDFN